MVLNKRAEKLELLEKLKRQEAKLEMKKARIDRRRAIAKNNKIQNAIAAKELEEGVSPVKRENDPLMQSLKKIKEEKQSQNEGEKELETEEEVPPIQFSFQNSMNDEELMVKIRQDAQELKEA